MTILSNGTHGPYGLFLCLFSAPSHKSYCFLLRWALMPLTAPAFAEIVTSEAPYEVLLDKGG